MGLESATYIDALNTANPLGTDQKLQGDDHLRLIKSVLKTTFPTATKPFNFPVVKLTQATTYTLLATDDGKLIRTHAANNNITVNLLPVATAGNGFIVRFLKSDSTSNTVTIDGDGSETVRDAATLVLSRQHQAVTIMCNGATWYLLSEYDPDSINTGDSPTLANLTLTSALNAPTVSVADKIEHVGDVDTYIQFLDNQFNILTGGTQRARFSANGLRLGGAAADVNEFSTDGTLAGDSDVAVPTEKAIKTYVDTEVAGATSYAIVLGTEVVTTSGTAIGFTSIPAGTKRITLMLEGVGLTSTDQILVQIGDSGGYETSGYVSTSSRDQNTSSNAVSGNTAGYLLALDSSIYTGLVTLNLKDASNNTWIMNAIGLTSTLVMSMSSGSKSLSAELDRIQITRNASATFDAGSINISYEA